MELELDAGDLPPSDWGPSELGSTNVIVPLYPDVVDGALSALPRQRDSWGYELCDLPIVIRSIYPSEVLVRNLTVTYSWTVRLDAIGGAEFSERSDSPSENSTHASRNMDRAMKY